MTPLSQEEVLRRTKEVSVYESASTLSQGVTHDSEEERRQRLIEKWRSKLMISEAMRGLRSLPVRLRGLNDKDGNPFVLDHMQESRIGVSQGSSVTRLSNTSANDNQRHRGCMGPPRALPRSRHSSELSSSQQQNLYAHMLAPLPSSPMSSNTSDTTSRTLSGMGLYTSRPANTSRRHGEQNPECVQSTGEKFTSTGRFKPRDQLRKPSHRDSHSVRSRHHKRGPKRLERDLGDVLERYTMITTADAWPDTSQVFARDRIHRISDAQYEGDVADASSLTRTSASALRRTTSSARLESPLECNSPVSVVAYTRDTRGSSLHRDHNHHQVQISTSAGSGSYKIGRPVSEPLGQGSAPSAFNPCEADNCFDSLHTPLSQTNAETSSHGDAHDTAVLRSALRPKGDTQHDAASSGWKAKKRVSFALSG